MGGVWMTHEELARAHRKLREEYDRTREIVDLLVEKFDKHTHVTFVGREGDQDCTSPPRREEEKPPKPVERFCHDCHALLQPTEKFICDGCILF